MSNRKKPKICIIYTGGTIGMKRNAKGDLVPAKYSRKGFIELAPDIEEYAEIEYVPFESPIDSSNAVPSDWKRIAESIFERRDEFRGFVVAHGTDTMSSTAVALSLAFGPKLNFPIVMTGAQTEPDVHHGDARINLVRAVRVAADDKQFAEVVVAFNTMVFRGNRAQKRSENDFDAFFSPAYPNVALIARNILFTPYIRPIQAMGRYDVKGYRPDFVDGVLPARVLPGSPPGAIVDTLEREDVTGLVIESYGAGTVPTRGKYSYLPVFKRGKELGKPVAITSPFPQPETTLASSYETHTDAVSAGAITTGNMTTPCAHAKLSWALARVSAKRRSSGSDRAAEVKRLLIDNYVGEVGEPLAKFPKDPK
ncbi:MAG TPA: asparaginase [Pyrinomonadaceae bacterium]|nr:asparaginase [Pyrinomonadaceae bacterium]